MTYWRTRINFSGLREPFFEKIMEFGYTAATSIGTIFANRISCAAFPGQKGGMMIA